MSNKKIRIFSTFLLFGIAAIFFPATALQNSIVMGQEYNPEYEENAYEEIEYYDQEYNTEYEEKAYKNENEYYDQEYNPYKNKNKNAPIVNIEKKLFVCNNVTDSPNDFECDDPNIPFFLPAGPDSGAYIPCNDEICPGIDESNFGAQIFKDVATVHDLSPEGTPVNLDKFHYTVTERFVEDKIRLDSSCDDVGFTHDIAYQNVADNSYVVYFVCVDYVGDCEGTIYPDEEKTCTIENYIVQGQVFPLQTDDDAIGAAQSSSSSLSHQSKNPVKESQSLISLQKLLNLRD
jgi:hypothetical protein